MADSLEDNPFFVDLQRRNSELWAKVRRQCLSVFVPHAGNFPNGCLSDRKGLECHIFQDSPYFKGEFVTLNKRSFEITGGAIVLKDGWPAPKTVRVVSEEDFYNAEDKAFKVYLIEEPLDGTFTDAPRPLELDAAAQALSSPVTAAATAASTITAAAGSLYSNRSAMPKIPTSNAYDENCAFLAEYPDTDDALRKVRTDIRSFNQTYVLVRGYEASCLSRLRSMVDQAHGALMAGSSVLAASADNAATIDGIRRAVESLVLGGVYTRLFRSLCEVYEAEDMQLLKETVKHSALSQADLGIDTGLIGVDLLAAADVLRSVEQYKTPIEKAMRMNATIEAIKSAIHVLYAKTKVGYRRDDSAAVVSADNLLPLCVNVVILARVPNLYSYVMHVTQFQLTEFGASALGFAVATFHGAVTFAMTGIDQMLAERERALKEPKKPAPPPRRVEEAPIQIVGGTLGRVAQEQGKGKLGALAAFDDFDDETTFQFKVVQR